MVEPSAGMGAALNRTPQKPDRTAYSGRWASEGRSLTRRRPGLAQDQIGREAQATKPELEVSECADRHGRWPHPLSRRARIEAVGRALFDEVLASFTFGPWVGLKPSGAAGYADERAGADRCWLPPLLWAQTDLLPAEYRIYVV